MKTRKNAGKSVRDMEDIFEIFKATEPELIPIFVARDLHKLPPVCFDHVDVTRLLKDIVRLQTEIRFVRENYATLQQLQDINEKIDKIESKEHTEMLSNYNNNVRKQRGEYLLQESFTCDSGPMGLPHVQILSRSLTGEVVDLMDEARQPVSLQHADASNSAVAEDLHRSHCVAEKLIHVEALFAVSNEAASAESETACAHTGPPLQEPVSYKVGMSAEVNNSEAQGDKRKSFAEIVSKVEKSNSAPRDERWIEVQRRRLRNKFIGNKGKANIEPNEKFKAADIQFYIYNVDKEATGKDIADYIMKKTNVLIVPEKMNMKHQKNYVVYRFLIPKHKLPVFMDAELWPDGVSFRQYIMYSKSKGTAREMRY